jgi:cytochrome c553
MKGEWMMTNKINMVLVSAAAMLFFAGCGDKKAGGEAITYAKSPKEVYDASCVKCHGVNGEGKPEKKAPALNDKQTEELELDLYDVKNGGTTMAGGSEHEVMEHNMKKLLAQGYDYDVKAMAEFLEKSFYKKLAPKEAPAAEPESNTTK